ncbi:MAG: helix-turn-helix domain-containing protein [Stellaceae bacterium]
MKRKRRRDDPARLTYSVQETAQILGISPSTVRRRIKDESIPIVEGLGKLQRIPKWWVDKQVGRE